MEDGGAPRALTRVVTMRKAFFIAALVAAFVSGCTADAPLAPSDRARGVLDESAWLRITPDTLAPRCELRPNDGSCGGRPSVVTRHFDALARYLEQQPALTPLGGATSTDYTFYGGGWAFTRWALDRYPPSEAAFLRSLVRDPATGIANRGSRPAARSFASRAGTCATCSPG